MTQHLGDVEAREHAEVRGREHGARIEHALADLEVAAREPHVVAVRRGFEDVDAPRPRLRVRSTITIASAPAGIGAPVMMRIGLARPDFDVRRRARGELADHAQRRPGLSSEAPAVSAARTA